ncbi:MAG: hypothetical protein LBU32_14295 [Clostridiales bacterium]|jgi:tetratricopeptide (TPR) repeat protein|nr:hypothetical protein [Clostridiales bacterium]
MKKDKSSKEQSKERKKAETKSKPKFMPNEKAKLQQEALLHEKAKMKREAYLQALNEGVRLFVEGNEAYKNKRYLEAVAILQKALVLLDKVKGPFSEESRAAVSLIFNAYSKVKMHNESIEWTINCYDRFQSKNSHEAAVVAKRVAELTFEEDPESSLIWSEEAIQDMGENPESEAFAIETYNLAGAAAYNIGEDANALRYYEKALRLMEDKKSFKSQAAMVKINIANLHILAGRSEIGLEFLDAARQEYDEAWESMDESKLILYQWIGNLYARTGYYKLSNQVYEKLACKFETVSGRDSLMTVSAYQRAGVSQYMMGERFKSIAWLDKAIDGFSPAEERYWNNLAECYDIKGRALQNLKKHREAIENFTNAYELCRTYGKQPKYDCQLCARICECCILREDYKSASEWMEKMLSIQMEIYGPNDPIVLGTIDELEDLKQKSLRSKTS